MSFANLSPTLETLKADYHQDIARIYYDWRPLMHSVGFTDEDFVAMIRNFSGIYVKQKERILRYRYGKQYDSSVAAELDDDERVENILLEEFIESIELPSIDTLPREIEMLKTNLQKDVQIVWNCLDHEDIENFDAKISKFFEKAKHKYIRQRERLRKIMYGATYKTKNVCFTSSDPEFIISNELNAINLMKSLKSGSISRFNFTTTTSDSPDLTNDLFDETFEEDSLKTKLMKLKKRILNEAKRMYFEAVESNKDSNSITSQLKTLQEKYLTHRERLKQMYANDYVPNKSYSEGSDIVLISQQWKSDITREGVDRSQIESIREQSFHDESIPKQIISDGTQEQDMIALACKTLKEQTKHDTMDLNKLNIVYELLDEAIQTAAVNTSILSQSEPPQMIDKHGKTFNAVGNIYSSDEPKGNRSLPMDPSTVDPTKYNLNDIINMSLKDLQKFQVPPHMKRRTVQVELDQLKRGYANALAKCFKKHINGTFDDVLLVLRKLNVLQDMYIDKRERIKMRYLDDYHTVSHELDQRSSTINVLLKPYMKKIMGRRYHKHRTIEDYVNELISEDTNRIVYKHLVASMESPIKKFPEVKHEIEQQYITNLADIRKAYGRKKMSSKIPNHLSPTKLLHLRKPEGDALDDIPYEMHPAERDLTPRKFEKIKARYAPMNEKILQSTAILDEQMLANPNDYLMLLLRAKNVLHNFDVESRDYAEKIRTKHEPEGVPIVKLHPHATTGIYRYKTPKRQRTVKVLPSIIEEGKIPISHSIKFKSNVRTPRVETRKYLKVPTSSIGKTKSYLPKPQAIQDIYKIARPKMIPQVKSHVGDTQVGHTKVSHSKVPSFIPKPAVKVAVPYVKPKPARRQSVSSIPISETPSRTVMPKRRSLIPQMGSRLPVMSQRKRAGQTGDPVDYAAAISPDEEEYVSRIQRQIEPPDDPLDLTVAPAGLMTDEDEDETPTQDAVERLLQKIHEVEQKVMGKDIEVSAIDELAAHEIPQIQIEQAEEPKEDVVEIASDNEEVMFIGESPGRAIDLPADPESLWSQKRIAGTRETKERHLDNVWESEDFDAPKDYVAMISPDEEEFGSRKDRFIYPEWADNILDATPEPPGLMSYERGHVFIPDMINLDEGKNVVTQAPYYGPKIPDVDVTDMDFSTMKRHLSTDDAIIRLVLRARQIQEDVAKDLGDATSNLTKIDIPLPKGIKNVNLMDLESPVKDLGQPLQPVFAPIPKRRDLMELDISHEELPQPINPSYAPLKPAVEPSSSSTIGTSSSEALFRLNLPKDFKLETPQKETPKRPIMTRNLLDEMNQKVMDDTLLNTSIPDESFFYDSDPEKKRKYYQLVRLSSSETSIDDGLRQEFARIVTDQSPDIRRSQLPRPMIESEDDLFETEMPEFWDNSLSDISIDERFSPQIQREESYFTQLPFPPSEYQHRRQRIALGRPMPAMQPPAYLYTLNEELQSPGGRYKIVSPTKLRREKVSKVLIPRTVPKVYSGSARMIVPRNVDPNKELPRPPIRTEMDDQSTLSTSSDGAELQHQQRVSRIPADLQTIIDKYEEHEIRSPLSTDGEEERLDQLRTCLSRCQKNCVKEYHTRPNKLKERLARVEEVIAQQIADEIANKSPKKITPLIDRDKAIAEVEAKIAQLREKKARQDKAREEAEQKRKKELEIAAIQQDLSAVDKDMEEWLKEKKKFEAMMAEKRKMKESLAKKLEALKSPPIDPKLLQKSAIMGKKSAKGVPKRLMDRFSQTKPTTSSAMSGQKTTKKPPSTLKAPGVKPSTSDTSIIKERPPIKRPQTSDAPKRPIKPSTSNTSMRAKPTAGPSNTSIKRSGETRPSQAKRSMTRLHKKAGFVKTVNFVENFKESPDDVKHELHKLFIEFSEKLKNRGILSVMTYHERKTTQSFEYLLEQSGFISSLDSSEIVLKKINYDQESYQN